VTFGLGELAERVGARVIGDPARRVRAVATLARAESEDLSFFTNPRYREQAAASRAGALLVPAGSELAGRDLLVHEQPYYALALLLDLLHPQPAVVPGVHATAVVGAGCVIDPAANVGALAVLGDRVRVGAGAVIAPLAVVGNDVAVGAGSVIHSHAVLYDGTWVGERCVVHSGVVLGSDGFGFATHRGRHVKVPQLGRVVIEDEVEIGANTTIDRALLDETRIGTGSKIDNLVQVGHNVRLGKGCLLVSQVGISGSTVLGDYVVIGGQSGASGHLTLGDGVRVAAKSAVFKDAAAGEQLAGIPAVAAGRWRRQQATLGRLDELRRRVAALEKRLGGAPEAPPVDDEEEK
jgi:UDP-3-O-[3-hydroxymyristoyl] glucosamine N-acyltransferase